MNNNLKTVLRFVDRQHHRRIRILLMQRLLPVVAVFSVVSSILFTTFHFFPWTLIPFLWDGAVLICFMIVLWNTGDVLLFRRPTSYSTARNIERQFSAAVCHPLLSIAMELASAENGNELVDDVYRRAREQLRQFGRHHDERTRPLRYAIAFSGLVCMVLSALLLQPRLLSYWELPFVMLRGATDVTVLPGSLSVPRYATVRLGLRPTQQRAPSCRLTVAETVNGQRMIRWLRPDSIGDFSYTMDSVASSFFYRFSYGTITTTPETVTVVAPPLLHGLQVTLEPPEYTRLKKRTLPHGQGDFIAYAGTRATVSIESARLRKAALEIGDSTITLTTSGDSAGGSFIVLDTASYTFSLEDIYGQESDSLSGFSIGIIPDEPPEVRFLHPGVSKNLEPAQKESLWVEGVDDLGIRSMILCWYKSSEGAGAKETMSLSPVRPVPVWQRQFVWELSRLSLYPGDTLFYWAYVKDSKTTGKPHYGVSDTFWFRIPTFAEIHRSIAERDAFARERMSSVQKRQKELTKQLEQLEKMPSSGSDKASWEQQQLVENVKKIMKEQADSLNESLHQLQENVEQMRKEGALGEEIAAKMDEVRKAMEELIKLYGDSLLFPRNEDSELTLGEMRQAVDKLKELLPELEERLENTLQFLDALKRDKELAMMAMRAEKMAEEQLRMDEAPNSEETRLRQKELLEQIDNLQKEAAKFGLTEGQKENKETSQRIDSLQRKMEQQLSGNNMPQSADMRQMSGNLAEMAQQLRSMMSSHMMAQLQALKDSLLTMADATLQLTSWQEQLRSHQSGSETARRESALSQQALSEALGILDRGVDSLPMLPPSAKQHLRGTINNALEASRAAVQSMGSSDGSFGMQVSAQSLKKLADVLMETVDAMNQQSGGSCNSPGGMQESLRRLSGRQAAINAATARMLRQMLQGQQSGGKEGRGGTEAGGDGESARREAEAAQKELAEELKKLGEKFGDPSGEGMKRRIEELEKEARALTRMLRQPKEEVTERQDRFLARMLQSALSLHREDQGKEERKSEKAGIVFTRKTGVLRDSLINAEDTFHMVRRRALQHGNYPPAYRSTINAYFDSLGVLYLK